MLIFQVAKDKDVVFLRSRRETTSVWDLAEQVGSISELGKATASTVAAQTDRIAAQAKATDKLNDRASAIEKALEALPSSAADGSRSPGLVSAWCPAPGCPPRSPKGSVTFVGKDLIVYVHNQPD